MKTRQLGKHGPRVSALGLGCMGLGGCYGSARDSSAMERLLAEAVELGVTFFDTAEAYGPFLNEELLGRALTPFRGRVVIATKFGLRIENGAVTGLDSDPRSIRASVEGSLQRLRIECIDLIYQHRVDPRIPMEDVAGTVGELIAEGKVRFFGLSEPGLGSLRRAHAVCPVAAVQNEYSLWWRRPEEGQLDILAAMGIGLVPFSPLGRGYLSGQLSPETGLARRDLRNSFPRFTGEAMRANRALIDALAPIATERGCTLSQLALAWLLSRGPEIVPIPCTTSGAHLRENLKAAELVLSREDLERMDAVLAATPVVGARYSPEQEAQTGR